MYAFWKKSGIEHLWRRRLCSWNLSLVPSNLDTRNPVGTRISWKNKIQNQAHQKITLGRVHFMEIPPRLKRKEPIVMSKCQINCVTHLKQHSKESRCQPGCLDGGLPLNAAIFRLFVCLLAQIPKVLTSPPVVGSETPGNMSTWVASFFRFENRNKILASKPRRS